MPEPSPSAEFDERVDELLIAADEGIGAVLHTDADALVVGIAAKLAHTARKTTEQLMDAKSYRGNAFRHCLWSCMMAGQLGSVYALQIGNYHEAFREGMKRKDGDWTLQDGIEARIDLKNNWEGIKCAHMELKRCIDCCLKTTWWSWDKNRRGIKRNPPRATTPGDQVPEEKKTRGPTSGGKNEPDDGTGGSGVPQGGKEKRDEPDRRPDDPNGGAPGPKDGGGTGGGAGAGSRLVVELSGVDADDYAAQLVALAAAAYESVQAWRSSQPISFPGIPEENYDPCDPPSNLCLPPSGGGGGGWQGYMDCVGPWANCVTTDGPMSRDDDDGVLGWIIMSILIGFLVLFAWVAITIIWPLTESVD
jgi:hypothetical protein